MLNQLLSHTPLLYLVQSLWRDEAFSILASQQPLSFIATKLGFEPPVYYTLLHFWIKLFGTSEVAARSLSVLGFLMATILIIEWGHTMYKKHWLAWYLPLIFFLNPMLLYYSFEVRTYAWYTFFATAMLVTFIEKKWRWFIASAVLGFYTHVYLLPFFGTLVLHYLWTNKPTRKSLWTFIKKDKGLHALAIASAFMIPWIVKIALEATRLKSSWYFPVDWQLVKSALGNLFVGYEGTPWYGWKYTYYLSLGIIGASLLALKDKAQRRRNLLFILFGALPLVVIIAASFIKPLYVNRYLLPVTIAEVLIVVAALAAIKQSLIQKIAAGAILAGILWFNWWYSPYHAKPPIRTTFEQIYTLEKPGDLILASDSLIYLEALYYAKDKSKVYLYNPNNNEFPWYVGDALITPSRMIRDYPIYPKRGFLVYPDTTFEIVYQMPL